MSAPMHAGEGSAPAPAAEVVQEKPAQQAAPEQATPAAPAEKKAGRFDKTFVRLDMDLSVTSERAATDGELAFPPPPQFNPPSLGVAPSPRVASPPPCRRRSARPSTLSST